ncbi:MAG: hypothetical protein V5A34_07770 [Halapricum sp.]
MSIHKFTTGTDRSVRTDSRGVSEVIGAILIFGLIVTLLVLIQANAVPAANKQVEFEHDQRVIQDFQALQGELYQVGTTGDPASATVETGVVYPNRFFLLNPSPAVGSLRTSDPLTVNITNARAEGNPGDYWNGENISFTTRGLVYTPRYNELQNPGTKYWEHSMLFSRYDNDNVYFDDPTAFIDGRQIRLTLVDGRLSGGSLSTTVEIVPISIGSRTLTVANENEPIAFTLGTSLSQAEWEQALDDEAYASVIGFDADSETVTIALNATQSYDLRISKVRVGTASARAPGPRYITDIEGNGTSIAENTSQRLVVEVRDEYNNPVSNVPVDAWINVSAGNDHVDPIAGNRSDSDGRVTFRYDGPTDIDKTKPVSIQTAIDGAGDASERARFDLSIVDSDGSGTPSGNETSDLNPYGQNTVQLEDAIIKKEGAGTDARFWVEAQFNNTYENRDINMTQARLVMYSPRNQQGMGVPTSRSLPTMATLYDNGELNTTGYNLIRGGAYTATPDLDILIRNDEQKYVFELFDNDGENYQPVQGDLFTITLEFDNSERITYLITPRESD